MSHPRHIVLRLVARDVDRDLTSVARRAAQRGQRVTIDLSPGFLACGTDRLATLVRPFIERHVDVRVRRTPLTLGPTLVPDAA